MPAVSQQPIPAVVGREVVGIVVLVEDIERKGVITPLASGRGAGGEAYVLVYLLHFIILRLGLHVAEDDAVHHKLAVVGSIAKVTAIGQVSLPVLRVVIERLVDPVPDGPSAEEVGRLDGIPVVLEVAHGIAHGMGIF